MPSPCAALDVGALLQQRAHGGDVAPLGRVGDRRAPAAARRHGDRQSAPTSVARRQAREATST